MKKLLGLLALTLAVTGVASADQDYLKNFNVSTEIRQGWSDIDVNDSNANGIGISDFGKNNRMRTRWRNVVGGNVVLKDEWGLDAKFNVLHDNDTNRATGNGTISNKIESWETDLEFGKQIKLGAFDNRWALGWRHRTGRRKETPTYFYNVLTGNVERHWANDPDNGRYHTIGQSNEIYVGPSFGIDFLGHHFDAKAHAVYWNAKGGKRADYVFGGNRVVEGENEGYGFDVSLSTKGKIAETAAGNFGYYVDLNNKFRDGNGHRVNSAGNLEKAKSSVYLDYIAGLNYDTPSFGGFYGNLDLSNEWEKHTAVDGYVNTASLWTTLGYKAGIETSVGTVSINPFIKYRPWHRETVKSGNDKRTIEINEARAGLKVGLSVQ